MVVKNIRVLRVHPRSPKINGEDLGVYYPRLIRDGWNFVHPNDLAQVDIFEKKLWSGWTLRKYAHTQTHPVRKCCYWDDHELISDSGIKVIKNDWEWAEVDKKIKN